MGFGHKCTFTDCGKCGASLHVHEIHDEPMGVLCQLTLRQGAKPGAAAAYGRKIRELAARADLQRALQQERKRKEAAEEQQQQHQRQQGALQSM